MEYIDIKNEEVLKKFNDLKKNQEKEAIDLAIDLYSFSVNHFLK